MAVEIVLCLNQVIALNPVPWTFTKHAHDNGDKNRTSCVDVPRPIESRVVRIIRPAPDHTCILALFNTRCYGNAVNIHKTRCICLAKLIEIIGYTVGEYRLFSLVIELLTQTHAFILIATIAYVWQLYLDHIGKSVALYIPQVEFFVLLNV